MELKQSKVVFNEAEHTYRLGKKELKGITSTLIPAIFGDYTENIPEAVLNKAAERGTYIHKEIELIDAGESFATDPETMAYEKLRDELGLTCIASEYIVTDGKHFASPIDKVYENDGVYIADIKTTSAIHYPELRFQLSWYATYYQKMNKQAIKGAYVIWLPKKRYGQPTFEEIEIVSSEVIHEIENKYLAGEDVTSYAPLFGGRPAPVVEEETLPILPSDLPVAIKDIVDGLTTHEEQIKAFESNLKAMKAAREDLSRQLIEQFFIPTGRKKLIVGDVTFNHIEATIRESIDSKSLKIECPDVYDHYVRQTAVKESVRITIKKKEE